MSGVIQLIKYLNPLNPYRLILCNFVLLLSFLAAPEAIKFLFFQRIENQYQYILVAVSQMLLNFNDSIINLGEYTACCCLILAYLCDRGFNLEWMCRLAKNFFFILLKIYIIAGNMLVLDSFLLIFFYDSLNLWHTIISMDKIGAALLPFGGGLISVIYFYGEERVTRAHEE